MTIRPTNRRAFSMAEILVVVAILAVLASITLLAIGRAKKTADKTRLGYQLQIITQGLEAYQTDFNSLPVTTIATTAADGDDEINRDGLRGARLLCKALMGQCGALNAMPPLVGGSFDLSKGHQDGKAGLGFAVPGRSGIAVTVDAAGNLKGKTYGPYLAADKFTISNTTTAGAVTASLVTGAPTGEKYDDTAVLLDGNGNPILYYPVLNPQAAISVVDAYVGPGPTTATPNVILPTYRWSDNSAWIPETLLRSRLGDTNGDKMIGVGETAAVRGKYILWSSGPDGIFGPNNSANEKERRDVDDVTSFQGQ